MAVKRRRAATKRARRPEPSPVVKVTSDAAWEKLKQKHANCLIIVHFSGAFSKPSSQLRPYFAMYAKLPQYSHVTFAEIDVEQLSVQEVAQSAGVQACPTIACWRDGQMIQMSERGEGGDPSFIRKMLEAHAGDKPSAPRWRKWLLKGLIAAGVIAAAVAALGSSRTDDTDKRVAAVNEQIETLQKSINVAKRRKQKKIVKQLADRMDRLTTESKALEQLAQQQGSSEVQLQAAGAGATPGRGSAAEYSSSEDDETAVAFTEDHRPPSSSSGSNDEGTLSDEQSGYSSDHK